jgi:ferrous iron transport protein B
LCTQVIDLGLPVVVALTMLDVAARDGISVDIPKLQQELKVPVVDVSKASKDKLELLSVAIRQQLAADGQQAIHYQPKEEWLNQVANDFKLKNNYNALLFLSQYESFQFVTTKQKEKISEMLGNFKLKPAAMMAEEVLQRYQLIQKIIKACVHKHAVPSSTRTLTMKIDAFLLHPFWGMLVFLLVFFLIFQALFNWAEYPMEAINYFFAQCSSYALRALPDTLVTRLLAEGILPGIGGVIAFVPQILILFGFIALLEETGYMSRISILTDRIFHLLGMNGKSSVSLIGGLACAVPAIMGTRTIESYKERSLYW